MELGVRNWEGLRGWGGDEEEWLGWCGDGGYDMGGKE